MQKIAQSHRRDSNPQPAVYKTAALPIELRWLALPAGTDRAVQRAAASSRSAGPELAPPARVISRADRSDASRDRRPRPRPRTAPPTPGSARRAASVPVRENITSVRHGKRNRLHRPDRPQHAADSNAPLPSPAALPSRATAEQTSIPQWPTSRSRSQDGRWRPEHPPTGSITTGVGRPHDRSRQESVAFTRSSALDEPTRVRSPRASQAPHQTARQTPCQPLRQTAHDSTGIVTSSQCVSAWNSAARTPSAGNSTTSPR